MSTRSAIERADLHDEAFARDPFPVWERLRHEAPLFHDTIDDVYLLTRYDDVAEVLRDDVTYSTWIYKTWFATVMGDTFAMHDGERHARERARVAPHLVGRRSSGSCDRPSRRSRTRSSRRCRTATSTSSARSRSGCPGS